MKQFKCPWCKREVELEDNCVMYQCVCGKGFDLKKEGEEND